jgi:hypothetical protein
VLRGQLTTASAMRASVTAAGHDPAEVMQVVAGQRVEQQAAGDLDVAGQDVADATLGAQLLDLVLKQADRFHDHEVGVKLLGIERVGAGFLRASIACNLVAAVGVLDTGTSDSALEGWNVPGDGGS